MAETTNVHEKSSVVLSNNKNHDSNGNRSDNSQTASNENFDSSNSSTFEDIEYNKSYSDMNNGMSRLSMHQMGPPINRFHPHSRFPYGYQTAPPQYYNLSMNQPETQAQLAAFTPSLMSIVTPYQQYQTPQQNYHSSRPSFSYVQPNEQAFLSTKTKSETTVTQPEYYVDSFAPNFSDKPSSNSNHKTKTKHVTFKEPEPASEPNINSNNTNFSQPSNGSNYSSPLWVPPAYTYRSARVFNQGNYGNYQYPSNHFYSHYPHMMNPRFMNRHRGMNMMPTSPLWRPHLYYPHQQQQQQSPYVQQLYQPKQLYDPNKPKAPTTSESHDSSKVIRSITPKNKKRTKQTSNNDNSNVSTTESIPHPITILRKPSADTEVTTPPTSIIPPPIEDQPVVSPTKDCSIIPREEEPPVILSTEDRSNIPPEEEQTIPPSTDDRSISSTIEQPFTSSPVESMPITNTTKSLPSHDLLSLLQSANCISTFNEYAQQKKLTLNYEFSSISSSSFTCIVTLDDRQFPVSSPCSSKIEAQKLACDQALRLLYRESCTNEQQSSLEFSNKHDYIAHRSVSTFQDLNVNELLFGRKTLACMLMITDGEFEQARVISVGTGNGCLGESNLSYADDGTALHDCHAEILARRGLIRFLFEEIKQAKDNNNTKSTIFQFNSTINKYQLRENITFHMYISSLPCGNAALNTPSNSIRYKQGHSEGTLLGSTSSTDKPIKSCSDKICRWNILGIQGGLLIHLLDKPIYLQTITLACETTFDRNHVKYTLCERLKKDFQLLPIPFLFNSPDINCPDIKSLQKERQVAKLQTNAFAWNITQSTRTELLEPMTGRLKNDRSISSLSKQNLFQDFTNFIQTNFSNDTSLSFTTYQQAKQLNKTYVTVKSLISTAFQSGSSDTNISWLSKSDQLEQFSIQ